MTPTKVLLLGATLDSDNRGIGALAMGAVSILVHRYQDCDIRFVDYGREATTAAVRVSDHDVRIPLINLRFSKKIWLPNNIMWLMLLAALARILPRAISARILASNPWLKQMAEAEVAVAVSGGDSFSDIYGLGRFFYMALPQLLVILLNRPLVLLPQTIGPMQSTLARRVAQFIIKHAERSYSRDMDGVDAAIDALRLEGHARKIHFGYDMGFILEPRKPAHIDLPDFAQRAASSQPLVGLNVSGLLIMGGYNGKNMFDLKCDYRELVERVVTFLIESKHANVLLVPHVFGTAAESDVLAIDSIYQELKTRYPDHLFRVSEELDQSEVKYVIGQCDMFIGSRMHACIAALSQAIPAIGIAYSKKFAGVLESIGVGHLVADPRELTIEHIIDMIDATFTQRSVIRSHLMKTMPVVKSRILNVLDAV